MMHSCRWDFNRLRPQRVEGASIHVAWDYNSTTNKLNRLYDDNRDGRATRTPRTLCIWARERRTCAAR